MRNMKIAINAVGAAPFALPLSALAGAASEITAAGAIALKTAEAFGALLLTGTLVRAAPSGREIVLQKDEDGKDVYKLKNGTRVLEPVTGQVVLAQGNAGSATFGEPRLYDKLFMDRATKEIVVLLPDPDLASKTFYTATGGVVILDIDTEVENRPAVAKTPSK